MTLNEFLEKVNIQLKAAASYEHIVSNDLLNSNYILFNQNHTANEQQNEEQIIIKFPNLISDIIKHIAEESYLFYCTKKNSPPLEGSPKGGVVTTISNTPILRNFIKDLPYNPTLKQLAKDKRKAGILSEVLFWQQVHKGVFHNIDFDRQRIIGNYIVDFYVKTLGLIIEIDGSSHDNKVEYDAKRQAYLENLGLKMYRISDSDIKNNLELVMDELEQFIIDKYGERTTPPFGHPSIGGELTTPPFGHPSSGGEFAPNDVLDYIHAVLVSPIYLEKYKGFLKSDQLRIPYPKDTETFWKLVALGKKLREIQSLDNTSIET